VFIQTVWVSNYTVLRAGPVAVDLFVSCPGDELLAVFRDDMRTCERIRPRQFFLKYDLGEPRGIGEEEIEVTEFRAPGPVAAARLDLLGINEKSVRTALTKHLGQPQAPDWEETAAGLRGPRRFMLPHRRRRLDEIDAYFRAEVERGDELRQSMDADGWVQMLAASPEEPHFRFDAGTGGRAWLMQELTGWDPRRALRAVLLAFPEADVILATASLSREGNLEPPQQASLPSRAIAAVSARAGVMAPVVVLTEGRTDAEFLKAGLEVLRPYLTDLIRFLDYERRPEGGVGALTGMIRAFAAAGIANRVVAVFDNDTAAADAMRKLGALPPQIQIMRYPDLDLARAYPAIGPSTPDTPDGTLPLADVNGMAASIELYLGRDVLTRPDGTLRPVRWTSYVPGMKRYQGEVVDKEAIHRAFRAKSKAASENPQHAEQQDWNGLHLIIDAICTAARSTRLSH
jgi:hypothetical protein